MLRKHLKKKNTNAPNQRVKWALNELTELQRWPTNLFRWICSERTIFWYTNQPMDVITGCTTKTSIRFATFLAGMFGFTQCHLPRLNWVIALWSLSIDKRPTRQATSEMRENPTKSTLIHHFARPLELPCEFWRVVFLYDVRHIIFHLLAAVVHSFSHCQTFLSYIHGGRRDEWRVHEQTPVCKIESEPNLHSICDFSRVYDFHLHEKVTGLQHRNHELSLQLFSLDLGGWTGAGLPNPLTAAAVFSGFPTKVQHHWRSSSSWPPKWLDTPKLPFREKMWTHRFRWLENS